MISALFFTEKAAARLCSQRIHFLGQLGPHEVGSAEISLSREQAAQLADSPPFFGDCKPLRGLVMPIILRSPQRVVDQVKRS